MKWNLSFLVNADPRALRAVRKMFFSALVDRDVDRDEARLLEFAMGETLTNARTHTYPGKSAPLIVELAFDIPTVTFAVHNHGEAVCLPTVPTALEGEDLEARGLYATSQIVDCLDIERNSRGEGTKIAMTKRLTISGLSSGHASVFVSEDV